MMRHLELDELLLGKQALEWELGCVESDEVFDNTEASRIINDLYEIEESLDSLIRH